MTALRNISTLIVFLNIFLDRGLKNQFTANILTIVDFLYWLSEFFRYSKINLFLIQVILCGVCIQSALPVEIVVRKTEKEKAAGQLNKKQASK